MLKTRSSEPEMLDDLMTSEAQIRDSLDFMRFVNAFFGGKDAVLGYFEAIKTPASFSVLDLGSGGGDIPYALTRWAAQKSKQISVTAVELNPYCLAYAREKFSSSSIRFLKCSAFDLETLGDFDYIISSMFFHHLSEDEIITLLKRINGHSRRGFLVNDLFRSHLHYAGACLASFFMFKKILFNDARLSVSRGFREEDLALYRDKTGIPFEIKRKPLFRILMSHEKCSD